MSTVGEPDTTDDCHSATWLSAERRDLDEQLAVGFFQAVLIRQGPIVAVADEHHRLPVQLVGEEHPEPANESDVAGTAAAYSAGSAAVDTYCAMNRAKLLAVNV